MTDDQTLQPEPGLIAEAAERFFPEGAPEPVELELFADLWERLRAFAADRGPSEADAVRLALATGLAYLSDQETLEVANAIGGHSADELERLLRRHIQVEADYAVMKHRLWLALQDNQIMSLRDGTLSKSVQSLQLLAEKLRRDIAQLQAENAALRAQQIAVAPLASAPIESAAPSGGWSRALAWFRSGKRSGR